MDILPSSSNSSSRSRPDPLSNRQRSSHRINSRRNKPRQRSLSR